MSLCVNCQQNPAEAGHLCEACTQRSIDAIMAQVSELDQLKPVDQLAPRTIEFKTK
jgi:hypothetical protein